MACKEGAAAAALACRSVREDRTWRAAMMEEEAVVSVLSARKQNSGVTTVFSTIAYVSEALSVVAPSVVCYMVASNGMLERSTAHVLGTVTLALGAYFSYFLQWDVDVRFCTCHIGL